MLKKLAIFLIIFALLFIGIGQILPEDIHVERSIEVDAPAATVFSLLNGYKSFNNWSPWAKRDPNAEFVYSGPEFGVGAAMSWAGNEKVRTGSQKITLSQPYSRVEAELDFGPQGVADTYFDIQPRSAGGVNLNWGFDTNMVENLNFFDALISRYVGLLMDKWVGADFDEGLAGFKAYAESFPNIDFSNLDVSITDVAAMDILYVPGTSSQSPEDIASALAGAYGELMAFISSNGIEQTGMPLAIARYWDDRGYGFDAAIPAHLPQGVSLAGNVGEGASPSGRAAKVIHTGSYDQLMRSYEKLMAWMQVHGYQHSGVSWEHYISDPGDTAEDELITHIYFQLDQQ